MILDKSAGDCLGLYGQRLVRSRERRQLGSGEVSQICRDSFSKAYRPLDLAPVANHPATSERETMQIVYATTRCAFDEGRGHAYHIGEFEEKTRDQVGRVLSGFQSLQSSLQQQEEPDRGLSLLGHCVGRLDHRTRGDNGVEVGPQSREGLQYGNLCDRVEVSSLVKHEIDMGEGLQTSPKSALRLAHALGDGAHLPAVGAQEHDYTVGFAKRIGAENDALIVLETHGQHRVFGRALSLSVMALVSDQEVDAFLDAHPDWDRDGKEITRTYELSDFNASMGFVTRVALAAEKADHHPDIDIRWNKVTLTLSTHSEGGLTARDLDLADLADKLA